MNNQYVFHSTWHAPADRITVREVLMDHERYPLWWPQVRSTEQTSDGEGVRTVCRSTLPYELVFTAVQHTLDDGTLAAELHGDLDGVIRWNLFDSGSGTRMEYEQTVTLQKPVLRQLSPLLRPAFRWNHAVMMRDGQRGLALYLAGFQGVKR